MHYHITLGIESETLKRIQKYLQKFESIDINVEPPDIIVEDDIKKLFLYILARLKNPDIQ